MKKVAALFIASFFFLVSCADNKKDAAPKKEKVKTEKKSTAKADPVKGKELFGSKGCTACHHETTKIIGPAVKDLASVYAEKGGDILKFLKGQSEAIVDTDPTQVSIMKNNLDTMVKEISDADLTNIVAYINSVK
ncbi:c-type cytochrome [Urechidicola vernalis]|uniref:C-type cytochrome n=1 Tax=Urechidicola vernalis TaxID=3075600 RepID=A0ABU2Y1Z8_9FLAO|nr:c-type cytochrome [Urechidicola sp. P050]MDT0552231.1 c-type cytochrome [Urechidicola sp. P050]